METLSEMEKFLWAFEGLWRSFDPSSKLKDNFESENLNFHDGFLRHEKVWQETIETSFLSRP